MYYYSIEKKLFWVNTKCIMKQQFLGMILCFYLFKRAFAIAFLCKNCCIRVRKTLTPWTLTLVIHLSLHRGAFCHFPYRWIYYCHNSKTTLEETVKTNLCALWYCFFRNNFVPLCANNVP